MSKAKRMVKVLESMGGFGKVETIHAFASQNGLIGIDAAFETKKTLTEALKTGVLKGQIDWWIGLPDAVLPVAFDGPSMTRIEMLEKRVWELERLLGFLPDDRRATAVPKINP